MGGKNSYASIKKYEDKAYDKVLVRLPKGQREVIQEFVRPRGESVNGFINAAISEKMERDGAETSAILPEAANQDTGFLDPETLEAAETEANSY